MVAKAYSEISIHALREEGDPRNCCSPRRRRRFLSTPSARRATTPHRSGIPLHGDFYPRPPRGGRREEEAGVYRISMISIHALREEGDSPAGGGVCAQDNFYPRPPRGGRRREVLHHAPKYVFLSTPSARRATHALGSERLDVGISIHALREEGDQIADGLPRILGISIHALREEGDAAWPTRWASAQYFYPRPPRGGRRSGRRK